MMNLFNGETWNTFSSGEPAGLHVVAAVHADGDRRSSMRRLPSAIT
jgi:hypothetical protein